MSRTIVIPAAGLGSRLGYYTKNYSKAMCTLGEMPIISHIISNFSYDDEIIILLGYKGDLLKQVVAACHPHNTIRFVYVDKYEGPDSGLGYSLSCAREYLQKPFLFWSCDTVLEDYYDIRDEIEFGNDNVMIYSKADDLLFNEYRHVKLIDNDIVDILPKDIDCEDNVYSYTGVAYINDYEKFWEAYDNDKESFINEGEVIGLKNLSHIHGVRSNNWLDMGNAQKFKYYKKLYNDNMDATILEKPDEAIWFIDDMVVKFHINEKFIHDRVERWNTILCNKQLNNGIRLPKLISYTKNTYTYKMSPGVVASQVITTSLLVNLLESYFDIDIVNLSDDEKYNIYKDFYWDKTISRINKYCEENKDTDDTLYINGNRCYPAIKLVNAIKWDDLCKHGVFTNNYHGDFHLENILIDIDKFVMLDFRQNFGKTIVGDMYYDIAKMWHSFIVNHLMVKDELFKVTENTPDIYGRHVDIDIHRTFVDCECEKALIDWLDKSDKYDKEISELMTCIIFLNIAACHVYPYSKFLFYLGKLMINNFYIKYNDKYFNYF